MRRRRADGPGDAVSASPLSVTTVDIHLVSRPVFRCPGATSTKFVRAHLDATENSSEREHLSEKNRASSVKQAAGLRG